MATTTRRFASALTALAVMGSGAQFFDPVANAVSSTEQDSNINCADARKAVDKADAALKIAQRALASAQANRQNDRGAVDAAKKNVAEKQAALDEAKATLAAAEKRAAELESSIADHEKTITHLQAVSYTHLTLPTIYSV